MPPSPPMVSAGDLDPPGPQVLKRERPGEGRSPGLSAGSAGTTGGEQQIPQTIHSLNGRYNAFSKRWFRDISPVERKRPTAQCVKITPIPDIATVKGRQAQTKHVPASTALVTMLGTDIW